MSRMPEHLVLLVVQADEAAHAPVRAALKGIEGTEYEIHWVTTPRAALAALEEHPHDAFLVDRELHEPGHNGLDVARRHPRPQPARAGDPARRPRRPRHRPRGDRDGRLGLPRAPEPGDAGAQPALRDHPPARAAPAGGVRGAPRARAPGRQRRPVGLGRARRQAVLLAALEGDDRLPGGRDRRRAGRVARPRAPRRPRRAHAGARGPPHRRDPALRVRAPDPAPRRLLPLDARARHRGARPQRPRHARRRLPDRRHRPPPGRAAPPARRAARRADRAAQPRAVPRPPGAGDPARAAPAARPRARRCCSWTSTASSSSTTRSATTSATGCWSPSRAGWSRPCAPATPSPGSAATSSRSCSTTSATPARRP